MSPIEFRAFCDKEIGLEEKLWNMLTTTETPASLLSYEALAENPLDAVNTQVNFLACDSIEALETVTNNVVGSPLHEIVLNFDDLDGDKMNALADEKRRARLQQCF